MAVGTAAFRDDCGGHCEGEARGNPAASLRSAALLPARVDLSEIRARSRGDPDARSPATTSTGASAPCHHGAASCCGELIGLVRAGRGATARRNHRHGLPG